MPRRKYVPEDQPITYAQFRTGITFAEARQMLWSNSDNSADWKYKRRGTVLGFMRALKQEMWVEFCARNPERVAKSTDDHDHTNGGIVDALIEDRQVDYGS